MNFANYGEDKLKMIRRLQFRNSQTSLTYTIYICIMHVYTYVYESPVNIVAAKIAARIYSPRTQ